MSLPIFIIFSVLLPILSPVVSTQSSGNITWWCSQEPYPDQCLYHMSLVTSTFSAILDRNEFIDTSLSMTMTYTMLTIDRIKSHASNSVNENEKSALSGCADLYGRVVIELNDTSSAATDEKQVNLCGALAYLETCQDGISELNVTNILPLIANNASKLIDNILAVNIPKSKEKEQFFSYNLENNFPSWLSQEDRLFLESTPDTPPPANVVVAQDGTGNFKTINEALNASSKRTTPRFVIYVKKGIYQEYLQVTRDMTKITMIGDGIGNTIITGNHSASQGLLSYYTATVAISGDEFIARGITFQNTAGPQGNQAVALRSEANNAVFYNCGFDAYQDTLLIQSKRQFFKGCEITGTDDFIWGDAAVVLQDCTIFCRKPQLGAPTIVTAQGRTNPSCPTGTIIHNSRVMPTADLAPVQSSVHSYLGRPWKTYARVVFMKTAIDSFLDPVGWVDNKNYSSTAYYGEYLNTGPGSATDKRVNWTSYHVITDPNIASQFTVANFISGQTWLPATSVPFTPGL